jgi:hypothetical protein
MNEPKVSDTAKLNHSPQATRPVEYVPPQLEVIDTYVQKVCKQLTRHNGEDYCDTDFVHGLTTFMKLVVSIQIRHLNRGAKHG